MEPIQAAEAIDFSAVALFWRSSLTVQVVMIMLIAASFWSWAIIETLRHTGIRLEELLEITHHSLVQHRTPGSGEVVPLLQIPPSKTDEERLLPID